MHGVEGLACKVCNPITDIVVTLCDEDSLLAVKGVSDGKCRPTYIEMVRQVIRIYAVAQEEVVPVLLFP